MTALNLWVLNLVEMTTVFPSLFPKRHWKVIRLFLLISIDLVSIALSYYLSYVLRLDSFSLGEYDSTAALTLAVYLVVHAIVFVSIGLYKQVWRYANFNSGVLIARATLVATVLSVFVCYFLSFEKSPPRSIPIIYWFISTGLIAFTKFSWRGMTSFKSASVGSKGSRCFIYGAGSSGELLARYIKANSKFPFEVVGFIDDDPNKLRRLIHGKEILGFGRDLVRLAKQRDVETVLIAMNSVPGKIVRDIVATCHASDLKPLIMPEIADSLDSDVFKPRKIDVADLLRRLPKSIDKSKINEFLGGKVVLVTGAGGSIGSEICRQIAKANPAKLILLDASEYNLYKIDEEITRLKNDQTAVHVLLGSVCDRNFIDHVFEKFRPEVIFHAAAYKHVPLVESNTVQGISNNVFGTVIVANASHRYGAKNFLMISSDKAVNPVGVMGQTKRACELIIQSKHMQYGSMCRFCVVRFGNVLGSSGSVIPKFIEQISNGGPVTVTDPTMTRYFMLVQEAVELVLQSITITKGGEIFVLNMGEPVNIHTMARQLITLAGKRVGEDIDIVFTGIRDGEKLFEELIYDGFEERTEYDDIFITKSKSLDLAQVHDLLLRLSKACNEFDEANARSILASLCSVMLQKKNQNRPLSRTSEFSAEEML